MRTEESGLRNKVTNGRLVKWMSPDGTCSSLFLSFFSLPFFAGFDELGKECPGRLTPTPLVGGADSLSQIPRRTSREGCRVNPERLPPPRGVVYGGLLFYD